MTAPVTQAARPEKIAMTAPVQQQGAGTGWRIALMLPAKYTIETAPKPSDPRVQFTAVSARLVATLRYSGRWTESSYLQHRDELLRRLSQAGIQSSGEPWLARYNAPFSLPFLRRNEVLIKVERVPD